MPEVNIMLHEILFSSWFIDIFPQLKHWLRDVKHIVYCLFFLFFFFYAFYW